MFTAAVISNHQHSSPHFLFILLSSTWWCIICHNTTPTLSVK